MSNLAQTILLTIGVAVGSGAGTYTAATIIIPQVADATAAPTAAETQPDPTSQAAAADTAAAENDLVLSPADFLAAAEACRGVDPSVGMVTTNDQQRNARMVANEFLRKALEAAGIDPKECAKR